jgi:hypothetical protein
MAHKGLRRITSSEGSGKYSSGARRQTRSRSIALRSVRSGKIARDPSRTGPSSKRNRAPRPSSLSKTQLKTRADVLAAHSDMLRDRNLIASQAAKGRGVGTRDFWIYIPKAFKKDASGRIRAVADRYVRRMEVPGPDHPILIKIKGSNARNKIARFRNDVFSFQGGDLTALDKWRDVTVQGHKLLTDPQILRRLGEQDNLPEHFGSEQVIPYSSGAA